MANKKQEHSKTWSEKAIDVLINCFQLHGSIWNITSDDYKDQKQKVFAFRRIWYVSARHQYDTNRYDYKNGIISETTSYCSKAATGGILLRKVVLRNFGNFAETCNFIKTETLA